MPVRLESDSPTAESAPLSSLPLPAVTPEAAILGRVHHELKTPLFAILSAVEILRQASDPRWAWVVGILDRNSEQLKALIEDLLACAELSRGQVDAALEPVDLEKILAEQAIQRAGQAEKLGVAFQYFTAGPIPLVQADPKLLRTAVGQLLDNAFKFNVPGGRVEASWSDVGDAVELHLANTGAPIPAAQRERIFEVFYQIEELMTRTKGGMGLGLALVRKAMDAQGGRVSVGRLPDGRNVFSLRLPKA